MRKLIAVVLLAACELQPAPKKQPGQTPAQTETAKPVETTPPPSAPAAPKIEIDDPCKEVGVRIAQVFIDSADLAQKNVLERERANITRKTAEACTIQKWSDDARACYLATKTPADIQACETKFTPPPAPRKSAAPPDQ